MRKSRTLFGAITLAGGWMVGGSIALAGLPRPDTGASDALAADLSPPMRIDTIDGKPIDTDVGHAAPCFADFDRDGVKDLLIGQFGEGKLRIYKNIGTNDAPRFKDYTWFKAGADLGTVPAG